MKVKQKILTVIVLVEVLVVFLSAMRQLDQREDTAAVLAGTQESYREETTAAGEPAVPPPAPETQNQSGEPEAVTENVPENISEEVPVEEVEESNPCLRIRLKTSDYSSAWHVAVVISCPSTFRLSSGNQEQIYTGGQTVTIGMDHPLFANGRIRVESESDELKIESIVHNGGSHPYPGNLDLYVTEAGIAIVNEVHMEDYLTRVVSCEMPARYGLDASRIQAVCARSFAWKKYQGGMIDEYGSVMDDSNQYQVYNSIPGTNESWQAVQDTWGMVLAIGGDVIIPYYFSTSCGYTSDNTSWSNGSKEAYLTATPVDAEDTILNLKDETQFQTFIKNWDYDAYEKEYAWFRWNYTASLTDLSRWVQIRLGDDALGAITKIRVIRRGAGGIVLAVELQCENKTVIIEGESTIRKVFGAENRTYQNKSQSGYSTSEGDYLPSAFFCVEEVYEDGVLAGYTFCGGGNGHGIGMTQNGAAAMLNEGINWEEVLRFFYPGTELCSLETIGK